MSGCTIDHSVEDVRKKLEEQSSFLPQSMANELRQFLDGDLTQDTLNEVFHLLKKYDLATEEERKDREGKMLKLLSLAE